jgi:N6-adenosine-specific RNA methylase IME4
VKYAVILADCPWPFQDRGSRMAPEYAGQGREYSHYETMSIDELCAMGEKVQALAADDAFLFLWAPHSMVLDASALLVIQAWGFVPKQEIIWVKTTDDGEKLRFGGGHYTRLCTEPLLLCRRGKAKVVRRDIPNVIFAPRGKHSAKPDASYAMIEQLVGLPEGTGAPYLELFARRRWSAAWDVWGDEVECTAAV